MLKDVIDSIPQKERAEAGAQLVADIIAKMGETHGADLVNQDRDAPTVPAELLQSIAGKRPDGQFELLSDPRISLLDTTLLTNANGEARIFNALESEVDSADQINIVMAFVRMSGISPFLEGLCMHCERGRPLRLLTTR